MKGSRDVQQKSWMRSSWQKYPLWDLVASEANYHAKCLVSLYNAADRVRIAEQTDNRTTEAYYARAFAELVAFIEDTVTDREHSPVFKLSDLVGLYRDRLTQLGVS